MKMRQLGKGVVLPWAHHISIKKLGFETKPIFKGINGMRPNLDTTVNSVMGFGRFGWGYRGSFLVESPYIPYHCMHGSISSKVKKKRKVRICGGCKTQIDDGCLSRMGDHWHPECFRCRACDKPICEHDEFSTVGNRTYHKWCYLRYPKCDVCKNYLPMKAGFVEYGTNTFCLQKYCPSHRNDGTPRCCSCERFETVGSTSRYLHLEDGRKLCSECSNSSLMNTQECQPLYLEIQDFYEGLNMKFEQQVPVRLVGSQVLKSDMEEELKVLFPDRSVLTCGRCWLVEKVHMRMPRIGFFRILDLFTYRMVRRREVKEIQVLYGLPRLMTGFTLAHEMMHAWLLNNGYTWLDPKVEEGLCDVVAHMWLDSKIGGGSDNNVSSNSISPSSKKGERSQFERKLGEFYKLGIEKNPSGVYGDGFREANEAVVKYGLKRSLDYIRLTGRFPPSSTIGGIIFDALFPR